MSQIFLFNYFPVASRKPEAGSRKPVAGELEQAADSRQQTGDSKQKTEDGSWRPMIFGRAIMGPLCAERAQ
jgi:hypothetical protein